MDFSMATTTMATSQINGDTDSNNATINHINKSKKKWRLLRSVRPWPLEPAKQPSQLWVRHVWQKPNTRNTMQHNLPSQSPVWLIVTSAICHNGSNSGCHHCRRTMAIGDGSNTGSEHRIDHLRSPRCLLFYGIEGTDTNLRTTYYLNLQQYTPRTYHTPNEASVRVLVWIPLLTWIYANFKYACWLMPVLWLSSLSKQCHFLLVSTTFMLHWKK